MPMTFHADGTIDGLNVSSMPAGSIIQVVNHSTTSRVNPTPSPADPISATSGVEYTTFNFTPNFSNSKLLLTSSTFMFGEGNNISDGMVAFATYGGNTIIGSVCNYAGYDHWAGAKDTAFVSFNHLFDSWGTTQKAISIRCCLHSGTQQIGINYPTGNNQYFTQYNSPNRHEVTFTMSEIKQ